MSSKNLLWPPVNKQALKFMVYIITMLNWSIEHMKDQEEDAHI